MPVRLPIFEERAPAARPTQKARPPVVLTAEKLFREHLAKAYPPEVLADLDGARQADANPGKNPVFFAKLGDIAQAFVDVAPALFGDAELALDFSDASVHRLAAAITRARRDAWLAPTRPNGPSLITLVVTQGAIYVGACIVRNHGGTWQVRNPLWESRVELVSRAGTASLATFQWLMKALGDEEIDENRLADRYRINVELPTMDPARLPIIAPADRRLPRLARVRYDTLYKHLRAHLPELRDVGDDFPTPERFEELGFRWLDFTWLGDGRMLLAHGPGEQGVHLFWLDAAGFTKAAFYPADRAPEHRIELDGDVLRVTVSIDGAMRVHESLWWGV